MKKPVLNDEQVQSFQRNGYLVADFNLPPDLLDTIVARVHPHYGEDFLVHPGKPARVQDAWKFIDEVRQLAVNKNVLTAIEQLLGRKPKPFQTLNFPVGTSQAAHSDTLHFNCIPAGFMLGVWVALEDIDDSNGPLVYYPQSHKLPELSMQDLGLKNSYEEYGKYERAIADKIQEHQLQAEYGTIKKGESLIWHANLLHGGAVRTDPERSRHSQVTHYYFEGCKYYTPMLSSETRKHYRNPEWISDKPYEKPGFITQKMRALKFRLLNLAA